MKPEAVYEAINLAKTNNQKAFGYLFESFWDYLYSYLLKKTGNEDQAEDIAVRTFAKAFDKIHTFNPSFKFETWLTTISKNIQIDQHRKQNSKNKIDSTAYDERTVTEIQDGTFVKEWMDEHKSGQIKFKQMREDGAKHQIEEVGAKLRSMMPWIASNKLVKDI